MPLSLFHLHSLSLSLSQAQAGVWVQTWTRTCSVCTLKREREREACEVSELASILFPSQRFSGNIRFHNMLEKCVLFLYITGKEKFVFLSNFFRWRGSRRTPTGGGGLALVAAGLKCTRSLIRRNPAAPLSLLPAQSLGGGARYRGFYLWNQLSLVTTSREPGTAWFA